MQIAGAGGTNRVRLPAGMPPEKFSYRLSLSFPPFLMTFSKDLVVFCTPGRALIELSIRRLLELPNSPP
jgi:hypothetical protein